MPSPKYPLKPLLEHRERQVDDATAELGGAIRAREAADVARGRAEMERRDAEMRASRVRAEEAERLARGELRAGDLACASAWEIGAREESARLSHAVSLAGEKVDAARSREEGARSELGQRMADRDVVAKDAARFEERTKKRALAAEEEAGEEAFRGGSR